MVLFNHDGVLYERGQGLDPALDEGLFVLRVLVFGVLSDVAVFLGFMDAGSNFRTLHVDKLFELVADLLEALLGQVCGLVVHSNQNSLEVTKIRALTHAKSARVDRSPRIVGAGPIERQTHAIEGPERSEGAAAAAAPSPGMRDETVPSAGVRVQPAATAY